MDVEYVDYQNVTTIHFLYKNGWFPDPCLIINGYMMPPCEYPPAWGWMGSGGYFYNEAETQRPLERKYDESRLGHSMD